MSLDLSAALDTIDHAVLIDCFWKRVGREPYWFTSYFTCVVNFLCQEWKLIIIFSIYNIEIPGGAQILNLAMIQLLKHFWWAGWLRNISS